MRDDKCYMCGRSNPGLWGFGPALRQLGADFGFRTGYRKLTEIPHPSSTWVFVDEHPDSILAGLFVVFLNQDSWEHLLASYHNGACGFAFADGHSEIKKWVDSRTAPPLKPQQLVFDGYTAIAVPRDQDVAWLQDRTTTWIK